MKICLFVIYEICDERWEKQWSKFFEMLLKDGITPVLLTTNFPKLNSVLAIKIPYHLSGFLKNNNLPDFKKNNFCEIEKKYGRYFFEVTGIPAMELAHAIIKAEKFYEELFKKLNPFAIFIWDASHENSQFIYELSVKNQIPAYYYENGFLPETWMVDSHGIGGYTDIRMQMNMKKIFEDTPVDNDYYTKAKNYYLESGMTKNISALPKISKNEFRVKYNIANDKKICVLLLSAQQGYKNRSTVLNSDYLNPIFANNFSAIHFIQKYFEENKDYKLIIQDHPINQNFYEYSDVFSKFVTNVLVVKENICNLYEVADLLLIMGGTTTQVEALWYEKPMGLLSTSQLSGFGVAYEFQSEDTVDSFMQRCIEDKSADHHFKNRVKFVNFLMKNYLIGKNDHVPTEMHLDYFIRFIGMLSFSALESNPFLDKEFLKRYEFL